MMLELFGAGAVGVGAASGTAPSVPRPPDVEKAYVIEAPSSTTSRGTATTSPSGGLRTIADMAEATFKELMAKAFGGQEGTLVVQKEALCPLKDAIGTQEASSPSKEAMSPPQQASCPSKDAIGTLKEASRFP